jgi:hypothetical protein
MRGTIFISCGQFTEAEKRLGKQISIMVKGLTGLTPFFAENVQDLNGLDANILEALRNCVAFITVLHPRGQIKRPDGSTLVRASVWIEQEIAIATYIHRVEKRQLPIIAFRHKSVGLEGIRSLLHLNPIEFTDESEVLAALPERLAEWQSLRSSGIELQLNSKVYKQDGGHAVRWLETVLVNETNARIEKYDLEVRIPSSILKHWNHVYPNEVPCDVPMLRRFRFNQQGFGAIRPRDRLRLATFEYCTVCAGADHGGITAMVAEARLSARFWVDEQEYAVEKTIKDLAIERDDLRGDHSK